MYTFASEEKTSFTFSLFSLDAAATLKCNQNLQNKHENVNLRGYSNDHECKILNISPSLWDRKPNICSFCKICTQTAGSLSTQKVMMKRKWLIQKWDGFSHWPVLQWHTCGRQSALGNSAVGWSRCVSSTPSSQTSLPHSTHLWDHHSSWGLQKKIHR